MQKFLLKLSYQHHDSTGFVHGVIIMPDFTVLACHLESRDYGNMSFQNRNVCVDCQKKNGLMIQQLDQMSE